MGKKNFNLSPRAEHCILRSNIKTIPELIEGIMTQSLLKCRNVGPKVFNEIAQKVGNILGEDFSSFYAKTRIIAYNNNRQEKMCRLPNKGGQ